MANAEVNRCMTIGAADPAESAINYRVLWNGHSEKHTEEASGGLSLKPGKIIK